MQTQLLGKQECPLCPSVWMMCLFDIRQWGVSSRWQGTFKKLLKVPIPFGKLDFWPGTMMKVKGQPMEGKEGSVN